MHKRVIGYGSIFHKEDVGHFPDIPNTTFLGAHELFYAGRYAIKHVIHCIRQERILETIWLPKYYCPHVKNWMEQQSITVNYYNIDPFDTKAQVNWSLFPPQDLVLVNNYWGLKDTIIPEGERPLILEDHSHGWLSRGCLDSTADFCIASLRKTLPIPLGGIAWKPKKSTCNIPLKPLEKVNIAKDANPMLKSWELIDNAMETKATCEHEDIKVEFLLTYSQGEMLLRNTQENIQVLTEHESIIRNQLFKDFNTYKKNNLAIIAKELKSSEIFKLIFSENRVPFGLLLAFKDWGILSNFKQFLIANSIYPAELWPQNRLNQEYNFLLNIHMDYRINLKDLQYIAKIINQWSFIEVPQDVKFNTNVQK
ncbi:hypothetical protein BFP77_02415 [Maribacter sp. 4U21]|uniref:hypothetical protein n=1 Tax=Maribacter sp. 4U21 TaxID=1889779 RepID=UPI000C14A787|nr:hypothetical protein [Maribacter sp. 4U21]PIB31205.1 hypothetical protein BFP77_02415 [Maribacter sp. 4U21]